MSETKATRKPERKAKPTRRKPQGRKPSIAEAIWRWLNSVPEAKPDSEATLRFGFTRLEAATLAAVLTLAWGWCFTDWWHATL